jgi:alpha-amylase
MGANQADVSRRDVLQDVDGGAAEAMSGVKPSQASGSPGEPVALQYFHNDWTTITNDLDRVSDWGFDAIWLMQPAEGAVTKEEQDGRNDPPLGYQPINLRNFDSELGTEGELTTLIDTAHQEDVDVYLDTVLNHMAAEPYSEFPYFSSWDFHNEGGIPSWAYDFDPNNPDCFENGNTGGTPKDPDRIECDPWWVENGDLLGLKDFKQEKEYVRGELKRYMEDMVALGADGYRFDAVKHIPESFFANYANQWAEDNNMFRVGEIITGSNLYLDGYVTAGPGMHVFDYPLHFTMNSVFNYGDMRQLQGAGYVSQNPFRAMPFVENHDTDGPSQYDLAHAFALTIEGYPMLYNINPKDWLLGYEPIKNMVWVKKNLAGGQTLWRYTDSDLAIYERESNLLVGLNNSSNSRSEWVDTSWANTELKDYAGNAGNITTAGDGRVQVTVPPNDSAEGWVFYAPPREIAVDANGEAGVQPGGEATISVSAEEVDQLVIEDLWSDWSLSTSNPDGGTVTDGIVGSGSVTIDYGSLQTSVAPSITVSLPERYVGGDYVVSLSATNSNGNTAEATATISLA